MSLPINLSKDGLRKLIAEDPKKAASIINKVRAGRVELARENPSFFCEYILRDESKGTPITQETPHEDIQQMFQDNTRVVVWTHPGLGKCQPAGARVLLPNGRQRRLQEFTERAPILIFDPTSLSYKVVEAGPAIPDVKTSVWNVELANGMEIRATANHPVYVENQGWTPIGVLQMGQRILTLAHDPAPHKEILDIGQDKAWLTGFLFMLMRPVDMAATYRRDHPASHITESYLGKHCPKGYWVRYAPDPACMEEVTAKLKSFGLGCKILGEDLLTVFRDPGNPNYTIPISAWVVHLGININRILRIPAKVRNSPPETIRWFFRGLLCGAKSPFHNGVTRGIPHTIRIAEVVDAGGVTRPLRQLALLAGLDITLTTCPNLMRKVEHGGRWKSKNYTSHKRTYTPRHPDDIFITIKDPDTLARIWPTKYEPTPPEAVRFVAVHNIRKIPGKHTTYALPVHDESHAYISGGIISHNTNQISIGRTLWMLGNDVNRTILIVSNTREAASRIIGALKRYIEDSPELHEVFPHLKPGRKWSEHSFEIHRPVIRKTPSVVAVGLHGSIMGMRADEIILDDVDGPDSVSTPHAKAQAMTWVERSALSRLNPDGGRIGAIGNVWADDDILHKLSRKSGYISRKFPVMNEEGEPLLPNRFPPEVIQQIQIDQGPLRFSQIYMCEARDEASALFKDDWLEQCCVEGSGKSLMSNLPGKFPKSLIFTGVDLGVRQSKGSDPTVIVTCMLHPDKRRQVLSVKYGIWTAKEIADNIADQYNDFGGTVLVENNGAQQFLVDILNHSHTTNIPVVGFETTGKKKHDPIYGVESLANEIASAQWIFPSSDGTIDGCEPAMKWLIDACRSYQRGKHTPDGLMAMWICREGMRIEPAKKSRIKLGRLSIRPR